MYTKFIYIYKTLFKLNTHFSKTLSRKWKKEATTLTKIFQITYLIYNLYSEYMNNFCKKIIKQTTQVFKKVNLWTNVSLKQDKENPRNTWKNAQHQ